MALRCLVSALAFAGLALQVQAQDTKYFFVL